MKSTKHYKDVLAINVGSANTTFVYKGKVVLDEPSLISMNRITGKYEDVGSKVLIKQQQAAENIEILGSSPHGFFPSYSIYKTLVEKFYRIIRSKISDLPATPDIIFSVPYNISGFQKDILRESAIEIGAQNVWFIYKPLAIAVGCEIDFIRPEAIMIVDIGACFNEISVIALGGVINELSGHIAGNEFDNDIKNFLLLRYNLIVDMHTAEQVKCKVGAALKDTENSPPAYVVSGVDAGTGILKERKIDHQEISKALDSSINKIENAILNTFESTPPALVEDIYKSGIYLVGGGSLLRGLDQRISNKLEIKVNTVNEPRTIVAKGAAMAARYIDSKLNGIIF